MSVAEAQDLVTVALRRARNLRPGMPNTFDMISQDQILEVVGNFTSYFFIAMVALSSVALFAATLPGWREIGPRTTDESYPQFCAEPAAVRVPSLYLCSRSSRRCGFCGLRPNPLLARCGGMGMSSG